VVRCESTLAANRRISAPARECTIRLANADILLIFRMESKLLMTAISLSLRDENRRELCSLCQDRPEEREVCLIRKNVAIRRSISSGKRRTLFL
jgi:hypothetical protein